MTSDKQCRIIKMSRDPNRISAGIFGKTTNDVSLCRIFCFFFFSKILRFQFLDMNMNLNLYYQSVARVMDNVNCIWIMDTGMVWNELR